MVYGLVCDASAARVPLMTPVVALMVKPVGRPVALEEPLEHIYVVESQVRVGGGS